MPEFLTNTYTLRLWHLVHVLLYLTSAIFIGKLYIPFHSVKSSLISTQLLLPFNSSLFRPHPGPCYNLGLFHLWYLTLRPHPSSPFLTPTKKQTHWTLTSSPSVLSLLLVGFIPFGIVFLLNPTSPSFSATSTSLSLVPSSYFLFYFSILSYQYIHLPSLLLPSGTAELVILDWQWETNWSQFHRKQI